MSGASPSCPAVAPGTTAAKLNRANYDLAAMKVFNNTLVKIHDNYVDQTRIDHWVKTGAHMSPTVKKLLAGKPAGTLAGTPTAAAQ